MEAKIIIVDLNQVMLSNLMMQLGNHTNANIEENMVRHMILNSLRSYKTKHGNEYGEMIIASDNTNYWRRKFFPYYKANRKKSQEKSDLDWNAIFEILNKIKQELKDFSPYRVIDIESAEADDIIATLVKTYSVQEKILIMSGDKDFIQLHIWPNVKQYDPTRKKWVEHSDPEQYLKEHILKGDSGDGVPNVLSEGNCFVVGERQKPLTAKRIEKILKTKPEELEATIARNYYRNSILIDLSNIPDDIKSKVLESYKNQEGKTKANLLNYFIEKRLKNLIEHLNEF
jgi:hypothetical protein